MAKKREPESSVESETNSEESEEVSEPDSEPETAPTESPKKAPVEDSESEEEEEEEEEDGEGSESESGSESDGPDEDVVVKPISSKPMKSGPKKPAATKSKSEPVTPTKATPVKRPAAAADSQTKDSKKARTDNTPEKKSSLPIKRFWSEEDEVALLKGMIDYADKKNMDPVSDLDSFREFIQKDIHVEVTTAQVQDKIRRLRKNFKSSRSREQQTGKVRKISNPHQREAYALAKKIWENVEGSSLANGSSKKKEAPVTPSAGKEVKGCGMIKSLAAVGIEEEDNLMRMAFDGPNVDAGVARMWKKLMIEEFKAYGALLDVRREKVNMMLDFLKS